MYNYPAWSPSPAMAASNIPENPHRIEVFGEGTVSASPDRAIIVLGTVTENVSLTIAQKENAESVSNIINELLKLNIPQQQIQTVEFRIDILYNYEDGKQIFRGYQITHLLQITINNLDQTGLVVDTAVANGANTVSSIQFKMAHPEMHYNRSLSLALENAHHKAMTIANTLGVTLNRIPLRIQEESRAQEPIPYQASLLATSAPTPIQPGELKITAAVKVQYSFY